MISLKKSFIFTKEGFSLTFIIILPPFRHYSEMLGKVDAYVEYGEECICLFSNNKYK